MAEGTAEITPLQKDGAGHLSREIQQSHFLYSGDLHAYSLPDVWFAYYTISGDF
jgi:hypothetical protein